MGVSIIKDPDETLDRSLDWEARLVDGETISSSDWTADAGITVSQESATDTVSTVRLTGGTLGTTYKVTNLVTTTLGRVYSETLFVEVMSR